MCTKVMGSKPNSVRRSLQLSILFLFFVSVIIFILTIFSYKPTTLVPNEVSAVSPDVKVGPKRAQWLDIVAEELGKRRIRLGLVNMEEVEEEAAGLLEDSEMETFRIKFDKVRKDLKWEELYPEWIDEEVKYGVPSSCPKIPLAAEDSRYMKVDVLVARSPCGVRVSKGKGIRDVFRLQVNLIVADLATKSGDQANDDRSVFVVFTGQCEPMLEIFKCDDLLRKGDDFWIYKPKLKKLKQKMEMPFGSCQLAPLHHEHQHIPMDQGDKEHNTLSIQKPRSAYVTLLHSSEKYVCGAIALAQSIKQTNSTKELVLIADDSITAHSIRGLREAGWKIKVVERIRSPQARKGAYNEWNYSKLRVWQLTEYDKVMFIDSDLIVVRNIDHFFQHPQLSAAANDRVLFNSGVMLLEPSECMFETLMKKRYEMISYNGGDQGFLNEVFTWWHRWPAKINALKIFKGKISDKQQRVIPDDRFAIHYLGLKPWMCYRDYDCNWDMENHHVFASDLVHERWWRVYDKMDDGLRAYCGLTAKMDERIRKWREIARPEGVHWSVEVKDPRRQYSKMGRAGEEQGKCSSYI